MFLHDIFEGLKDGSDNPCWKGYHPVGTKKKNGKTVPNCVPNANEAANAAQQAAIAIAKKKEQGVAEGSLNEFAPDSNDGGEDGFSDEMLKQLASQWYNGDEDPRVERTLMAAGWEIGQDEGYDDEPGVFVVQAGDINGNSYMSWPAHELKQGVAEGVATTIPELDAKNYLRKYGADHFQSTTNELHFYKNGKPFSVDLVLNPDATRSVTISSLNAARRGLTGQGVAEGQADQVKRILKHKGKPVGEIGIDPEASPGNGQWYVKHYATGHNTVGFDSMEEALAELKYIVKQGINEAGYSYSNYDNNRTGFRKPSRDLSGEGEPEGMFAVMIDGRPWKEFTSNKAFAVAKTIATKYPNKQVQVKWPNGALNTVKEDSWHGQGDAWHGTGNQWSSESIGESKKK